MDFMNRNVQPTRSAGPSNASAGTAPAANNNSGQHKSKKNEFQEFGKWFRVSSLVLLFSVTILIAALSGFIAVGGNGDEGKFLNKKEYQAVFVNVNGSQVDQVYFGHITSMSSKYIHLTNIFYLQDQQGSTGTKTTNGAYTLVKLGCELHEPEDEMVINRDQVYFWENLKPSGKLAQKATEWYKNNPNGQQCSDSSSSTQQSSASPQTPANTGANGSAANTNASTGANSNTATNGKKQ